MIEDISLSTETSDAQNTEILSSPGQVVIEEAYITRNGIDYDVMNFMISFVMYEDIYKNFMSANAVLIDAASLITTIGFTGSETFTIAFRTRQAEAIIKKTFNVYSVKDRGPTANDREQGYTLALVSIEHILNNNVSLSQKYSGSTDQIVEQIYDQAFKIPRHVKGAETFDQTPFIITGGPHRSKLSFVPTFWSPAKAINHVANYAIGTKGEAPNYLFFETNRSFMFTSIEDLIQIQRNQNKIFANYIYSPSRNTIQFPTDFTYQFPEIAKNYSIVRAMSSFQMFDTIEGQDRGFYGSTVFTFDMIFKEYRRFVYNHFDGYERFNHMQDFVVRAGSVGNSKSKNTRPFGSDIFNGIESKRIFRSKHYRVHDEYQDPMYQSWLPQRNSLLTQLLQNKIIIEVPGRSDVEVGKLVNFLYPKMTTETMYQPDDDVSGLYMITAIKHGLSRQEYSMTLELTKDSANRYV